MKAKIFLMLLLAISSRIFAQQQVAVYTHDGSKIVGEVIIRDSVNRILKVKILGGSELAIKFNDIQAILNEHSKETVGQPYFGFGLGASLNANNSLFQFDVLMGYQFTRKFQAGIGFCASEIIGSYVDLRYFLYHKKFFSAGVFSQPGIVLANTNSDYYYTSSKVIGLYSNTGISLKLMSSGKSSFSLNLGYQFVNRKESYQNWNGQSITDIKKLNRYLIQGIFAF